MGKIGKKPVIVPPGVKVSIDDGAVNLEGSRGKLSLKILSGVKVKLEENRIVFWIENEIKQYKANWGTMRALTQNAIAGVSEGFSKTLEVEGVGFRVNKEGDRLILSIGFSHPVKFSPPAGINFETEKNKIRISGIDKALVGETAAKIRSLKKPEPYKGKGIRYENEVIRRKAGKKVAAAG